ncbi:MAG: adenine phosphoribosyltransferase [Candidatus Thermoplasmatota archaeon]|nr:adenine phosphoribosyltransferase [Candidatus Thermoplasmatota archaeon]MBU1941208.1 adenine phosphoribosyltransferase [Candidatus Thermoplasmatota archaeon]
MTTSETTQSLKRAPIVKKGDYYYVIHPITDGIPFITPALLKEISNNIIQELKKIEPLDRIVTMEAMGIPLATMASIALDIPFTIIRKRSYGLKDEHSVAQTTGYSQSKLYINGLQKGDRIAIVDDVLSTGGTLRAVLTTLTKIGVETKGVIIAIDKGTCAQDIATEFNIPIRCLTTIEVHNGILQITS